MDSLALIETRTIAAGIGLLDTMLKRAEVTPLRAVPICSGRFMILLQGEESSVAEALVAVDERHGLPVTALQLTGVSDAVFSALRHRSQEKNLQGGAVGVIETRRAVVAIAAADAAVKQAAVSLLRLHLASGINGKGWVLFAGDVAAIEEAVAAGCAVERKEVLDRLVLPSPSAATLNAILPGGAGLITI